jgi:two-component system, chemotaxis family, sensor kinase CheA
VPEPLKPTDLLDLLCLPGFSTRDAVDLGSGRGVGMAVVKNTVTELGGELGLQTEPGRGTAFTLRLPLTLAIADALLIGVGSQRFALPQSGLQELTTVSTRAIQRLETTEFMRYRAGILPLVRLARLFRLLPADQPEYPVLVIGHGPDRLGLVVERVLGQREIMVRALSDPLLKHPVVSGATELGDGRAVLILDPLGLIQTARLQHQAVAA